MRVARRFSFLTIFAASATAATSAFGETLSDAIALAYQTNPTLQAARANQRATDEEVPQAKAGLRPTVQAVGTLAYDAAKSPTLAPGSEGTSGAFLEVTQPVYTGGRVSSAIDAATADDLEGQEALRQQESEILLSVVTAYVDVRRDEKQLEIAEESVELLKHQLDETDAKFEFGEATRTDTSQARGRLAQGEAGLTGVRSQLTIDRASYDRLVGQDPTDLAPEPPIEQLLPSGLDAAFDAAEQGSPQLLQARYAEAASAARLTQAKAAGRPSIAVQGSIGYAGGVTPFGLPANSPFADFSRNLAVQATASVPIYSGGAIASQVRQAAERNNADRMTIEAARRAVIHDVSQAWDQLITAQQTVKSNETEVEADTAAFEGARIEQQQDLRTTLDVLNAEQELENAKLALAGATHDEYVAAASVLGIIGALTPTLFNPDERLYDLRANAKGVERAGGLAPIDAIMNGIDSLGSPRTLTKHGSGAPQ